MENEILESNILSIAISELLMLIAGMILYYFKENLAGGSIRFFLPIPHWRRCLQICIQYV
jgi:hypothetical protein